MDTSNHHTIFEIMKPARTNAVTIEKARGHMSVVAVGLVSTLGPIDAVGVLIGAAVGILTEAYGDEAAADWLRKIADEIATDEGRPDVGHA